MKHYTICTVCNHNGAISTFIMGHSVSTFIMGHSVSTFIMGHSVYNRQRPKLALLTKLS